MPAWYFPPSSVNKEFLQESPTPYTCPWKGECQYFNVGKDGDFSQDYATSMALIILQMPNRYLPVYAGKGPGS